MRKQMRKQGPKRRPKLGGNFGRFHTGVRADGRFESLHHCAEMRNGCTDMSAAILIGATEHIALPEKKPPGIQLREGREDGHDRSDAEADTVGQLRDIGTRPPHAFGKDRLPTAGVLYKPSESFIHRFVILITMSYTLRVEPPTFQFCDQNKPETSPNATRMLRAWQESLSPHQRIVLIFDR